MANRHLSRTIIVQTLFEWDFNNLDEKKVKEVLKRNAEEFGADDEDLVFMEALILNVLNKKEDLDNVIRGAAPEWPLEKISPTDRNILRMGLTELLFSDRKEVPPKVAINESIELAKSFGGPNSGRFVNGVLGAVYKEIGEPNKDDKGKKNGDIDITKLPIERLGGAVVYAKENDKLYLAFVHDVFGYWTLSKGHLEEKEDEKTGTIREIKEELGIDITIEEKIGDNEYIASDPKKGKIRKQVIYFLAQAKFEELKLGESGGLDDARWFSVEDLSELRIYKDIMPLIKKGVESIKK